MRKSVFGLFAIVVVMSMLFGMAVTPAAAKGGEKSITFISAQMISGKGVVLWFDVNGEFKSYDGVVKVHGQEFSLDCQLNGSRLVCMANRGLSKYVGEIAQGSVNDFSFGGKIHEPATITTYCYNIVDYDLDYVWGVVGSVCGDRPAHDGDYTVWYNPEYETEFTYWYATNGDDLCAPRFGEAFYYNDCGY